MQLLSAPNSCQAFDDIKKLLPILQYHMSVDVGESGKANIVKHLKRLTKLCHLDDYDESHQQHQKILYNSGTTGETFTWTLILKLCAGCSIKYSNCHLPIQIEYRFIKFNSH